MDDPGAQGSLPEPFLEHGLFAAVDLHRQPVGGRFENGPKTGENGGPGPPAQSFAIVGQAVRRRDRPVSGGGGGRVVGVARVFRETRISRGGVHAARGIDGDRRNVRLPSSGLRTQRPSAEDAFRSAAAV